jgi:hypothetical protein
MYRRHTLSVKNVVHDVYPRVPPLWATQNTAHDEQVSAYTLITHGSYTRDTTDSILAPRGALKKVDARDNNLESKGRQALKKAAGSRCMCACQHVFNYKVLVLTHSPPSQDRTPNLTCLAHHHWEGGVRRGCWRRSRCGGDITGGSAASLDVTEAVVVRSAATLHTAAPPTGSARVSTGL